MVFASRSPEVKYDRAYYRKGEPVGGYPNPQPQIEERLKQIERYFDSRRPLHILDVGCSMGVFLRHCRESGHLPVGVEISAEAAQEATARGLQVWVGGLEGAPFEPGSFDCVHVNHVLEHLFSPLETLRRARQLISSRGLLVVEVPNEHAHLGYRIKRWIAPGRLIGELPTAHTFFFSPRTLRFVLERAGFRVLRVSTPSRPDMKRPLAWVRWKLQDGAHLGWNIEAWCVPR
jgi:SAM-dependent methyltransferase